MKFCRYCGAKMSDDASFCTECGKGVDVSSQGVDNVVVAANYHSDIKERNLVVAIILT